MSGTYSMIETLRDFVDRAGRLGIEYMVTGSFAMSAYGEIRLTRDIDIVVQLSENQVPAIVKSFGGHFYVSETSVRRAIVRRSMFNMIKQPFGEKIDCIVQKDTEFARTSFGRRRLAKVLDVEFWITTKEDLIIAKLQWSRDSHSELQIRDIANLTSTEYDSEYLMSWIDRLDLSGIWNEVEHWKIRRDALES
ncbi:MAG TPA: hypothetical protein PKD26_00445 [Pyrinomonadaceae bacterium]|nr:hypothetical protein [Pyrinomonadaceae bacterium]